MERTIVKYLVSYAPSTTLNSDGGYLNIKTEVFSAKNKEAVQAQLPVGSVIICINEVTL